MKEINLYNKALTYLVQRHLRFIAEENGDKFYTIVKQTNTD